jgi:putative transposase
MFLRCTRLCPSIPQAPCIQESHKRKKKIRKYSRDGSKRTINQINAITLSRYSSIILETLAIIPGCWHKQPGAHEVALTLRHAALPKIHPDGNEFELERQIYGIPLQYFFTDGGKDLSKSKLIKSIGKRLGFQCELRDRPIQGGIIERLFKTINTEILDSLPGYQPNRATKEQIQKAEKEACLTLEDLDKILADFLFIDYNHQPYPENPTKTRHERWFIGMGKKLPEPLDERKLDICLMKEA